ncbi:hypothetical protein KI387_041794, partial [Taxus chinensis]
MSGSTISSDFLLYKIEKEDMNMVCNEGKVKERTDDFASWSFTNFYSALLEGCIGTKSVREGKTVHAHMIKKGCDSDTFLQNNLVNFYGKCRYIDDACQVFDRMCERNLVSWTTMITGYCQHGYGNEALRLFCQMHAAGLKPNDFTFGVVLKACAGLAAVQQGNQIHACVIKTGYESDVFAGSALVDMYAKCESMDDAHQVFDEMPERNVVSWNAMIAGCVQNEDGDEALKLFGQLQLAGIKANHFTLASILKACASVTGLDQGRQFHSHVVKSQIGSDAFVGSALIDLYAKCGNIQDASKVFYNFPKRDAVIWSGMIAGYAHHGCADETLKLFCQMQWAGLRLDHFTFASVLSVCTLLEGLEHGIQIHAHVIKTGYESDASVGSALVNMYVGFRIMEDAEKAFSESREENIAPWNAMIAGFIQNGSFEEALRLFSNMRRAGMKPNQVTYCNSLRSCASLAEMEHGKRIHAQIIILALECDVFVGSALLDMYCKCGSFEDASVVFNRLPTHDVVSWTAMIAGYAQYKHSEKALKLYLRMASMGIKPNHFTYVIVLKTCASLAALEQGMQFHAQIIKSGYESDVFVGSALVDMYAKSGNIEDAEEAFDRLSERDMVSWSAMITGYAQHGHGVEALKHLCQMQRLGMKGDQFTFASSLTACADLAALEQGKCVHAHIIKTGFNLDIFVESALIDMYSKCGSIEDSWNIFEKMSERNSVSWTAMIAGCAQHGQAEEALQLFERMQLAGMKPDSITFVGVLSACSRVGLVDKGRYYFDSISQIHCMTPTLEHYACMVDILGRAGCLLEAEEFINQMPFKPSALLWRTLLSACRTHGDIELGKRAAEWILDLEPQYPATYVLLSNIYAAAGKWDDAKKARNMMKDRGLRKKPGCSWIEIKNKWHTFMVADRSHPQTEMIYTELRRLTEKMKVTGHMANTNVLLHDMEQEWDENSDGY